MSAKGLAVQAAKKVQQEAMNQDGQGADEDMLAAMRHVASHPRRPGQAETEFRRQIRRWLQADIKNFMAKMATLEEAHIEAEAKKAAQVRKVPEGEDEVEEPASDVELRRRMQELLDEVRKGET
jgi:hypothetical protein